MKKFLIYGLFVVNLAIIFWFWWQYSGAFFKEGDSGILIALGRIFALLAVYFVLMQFVLMGRSVWVEQIFGLNNLARVHHLNGVFVIFFIIFHPVFITAGYAMSNRVGFISQLGSLILNTSNIFYAFLALILFVTVVFFSIYIVRKKLKYETWYYVHLTTYVAVVLAWGHQLKLGGDFISNQTFVYYWYILYLAVFGNLIFWRFLRPLFRFYQHRFFVKRVEKETDSAVSMYIAGKDMEKFQIAPGQFMIFRFLSKDYFWQAHPFSLSYAPKNNELRITVKNSGDFTSQIKNLAVGTPVFIDGPYGTFIERLAKRDKFLFIAAGVGITPIRSLIESIAKNKDSILIYGNKTEKDTIFKSELDKLSSEHNFPIHYVMSEDKNFKGEQGRINIELVKKLVSDFKNREIYICGPAQMMISLRKDFQKAGVRNANIHCELFSFK